MSGVIFYPKHFFFFFFTNISIFSKLLIFDGGQYNLFLSKTLSCHSKQYFYPLLCSSLKALKQRKEMSSCAEFDISTKTKQSKVLGGQTEPEAQNSKRLALQKERFYAYFKHQVKIIYFYI